MFTYSQLNATEQADLPKLIAEPIAMPSKFEDSTHQLWHCQTSEGEMVLKVCNVATVAKSSFWLGLNHLFAVDFPKNLENIHLTHDFLAKFGTLNVPELMAASAYQFVLTRFLAGVDLDASAVDDKWVVVLAKHITKLHQHTFKHWGSLDAPKFSANDWSVRLYETLNFLAGQHDLTVDETLIHKVLAHVKTSQETDFVPMMLDLRWDQLRVLSENELALVDLDAFIIAPRALDLVLLEYMLTPPQLILFKQCYLQTHSWPDYSTQKSSYQLLLFLMNVLGETDLARWMHKI